MHLADARSPLPEDLYAVVSRVGNVDGAVAVHGDGGGMIELANIPQGTVKLCQNLPERSRARSFSSLEALSGRAGDECRRGREEVSGSGTQVHGRWRAFSVARASGARGFGQAAGGPRRAERGATAGRRWGRSTRSFLGRSHAQPDTLRPHPSPLRAIRHKLSVPGSRPFQGHRRCGPSGAGAAGPCSRTANPHRAGAQPESRAI